MAVLNVANNNDSGAGSLRQAVLSASNGDTIVFDAGIAGKTINLTTGQLLLNKNLTIDGSNRNITISGFNNSRVFAIPAGNSVILNELSFINGNGTGAGFPAGVGGAIINSGTLTANKVNVRNNQANFGGGIASGTGSTFNLNQSTIDSNQAVIAAGGIVVGTGIATISESTISRNISPQASAFQLQRGTATLSNSTVSNNFSPVGGKPDAILNLADTANSSLTIVSSTIAFNSIAAGADDTTAAGVYSFANLTFIATTNLSNSIIANNTGGSSLQLNAGGAGTTIIDGSAGFNLVSDSSIFTFSNPSNLFNTNPLLAPLGDYGGSTQTLALLNNSPAINSGVTPFTLDQRGIGRPVSFNDDRGAFESTTLGLVIIRPTFNGGSLILGSNSQNLIFGDQLNLGSSDTIAGFAGDDTIDGLAGNDSIDGGFGNDSVVGGFGNDTLLGNIGDDTLIGARPVSSRPQFVGAVQPEFDVLVGGVGNDLFVLGDAISTYYAVDAGYAVIRDYEVGDRIQRGQAALVVDALLVVNPLGTGRTLSSLTGDLVAVIQGSGITTLNIIAPPP